MIETEGHQEKHSASSSAGPSGVYLETGWDLGPLLQRHHQHTPLCQQRNIKKLYGTKNHHVHAQLGQILLDKTQRPKNSTATSEFVDQLLSRV